MMIIFKSSSYEWFHGFPARNVRDVSVACKWNSRQLQLEPQTKLVFEKGRLGETGGLTGRLDDSEWWGLGMLTPDAMETRIIPASLLALQCTEAAVEAKKRL